MGIQFAKRVGTGVLIALAFVADASALDPKVTCVRGDGAGTKISAPGSCPRYYYNLKNKYGNCNANCDITEQWGDWVYDVGGSAAVTGKRLQSVRNSPNYVVSRFWAQGGCSDKNENKAREDCDKVTAGWNQAASALKQQNAFCPDENKAEFRDQNGIQNQTCGHLNPETKCAGLRPYRDCTSFDFMGCDGGGGFGGGGMDPGADYCCGPDYFNDQQRYSDCYSQWSTQYAQCMNNLITGPTDCYCKQDGVPSFYKFDTSVGAWKCKACKDFYPDGFVEDPTTGTSCKAPCQPPQWYNAATRTCESNCPQGTAPEMINGSRECLAPCALGEVREGRECKRKCPSGMSISADGTQCECNSANFAAGTNRYPVAAGASALTTRYSVWRSTGPIPANGTATNTFACACGQPGSPVRVSLIDSIEAITDPVRPPYGPVPTVTAVTAGVNTYACGCPNFNEKFVASAGEYQCVPRVTPATPGGPGVILADVPAGASIASLTDRQTIGIVDAISDNLTSRTAMLRSGTTTADLAVAYTRKVWKCQDGFKLDTTTNQCKRKDASDADILADQCSDATPVRSSDYLTDPVAAANFNKLTNRNFACCLGVKTNPLQESKFHCLGTDASAYANFDEFYDAGGGGGKDWNGIPFPNRFFLRDSVGRPLVGVYRKDGTRCTLLDALSPTAQLAALSRVVTNVNADRNANRFRNITGVNASAADQQNCVFVLRTAIEMTCAPNPLDPALPLTSMQFASTSGDYKSNYQGAPANSVRRCFQPEAVRVHYSLDDMSVPDRSARQVFRKISSAGADATAETATSIDVQRLIRGN